MLFLYAKDILLNTLRIKDNIIQDSVEICQRYHLRTLEFIAISYRFAYYVLQ